MGTMQLIAAAVAVEEVRKAPTVEKEDDLLPFTQCLLDALLQRRADQGFLKRKVYHLHTGHASACHTLGEAKSSHLIAVQHEAVRLKGRGRTAHDQGRAFLLTTALGNLSGMITGGIAALIAVLMLLVEDDQTKIFKRSKHGTSGTYCKVHFPSDDALPLLQPLAGSES